MEKKKVSLKWGLLTTILLCWIAAVLIVIYIAGILINVNFDRNAEQTLRRDAEGILDQIQQRLSNSMESSREVSYDGIVRTAYRQYRQDRDSIALYRSVTEYLYGNFSRDAKFKAVFISFWDPEITSRAYVINEKSSSYQILQQFLTEVRPQVMEVMADADTNIRFLVEDGQLYMCRNLLDSGFRPYATVTMLCDTTVLFSTLQPLTTFGDTMLRLDDMELRMDESEQLFPRPADHPIPEGADLYTAEVDGHSFAFYVVREPFNIWTDLPGLRTAAVAASLAVLPILVVMISVFYKTVSEPIQVLVSASKRVRGGERGYQLETMPNNQEFLTLYNHFNAMSAELKQQFDRSRLEQQALQQAQIKALQSQINPHFLNNTLEVINWEARIAGNDNVSEMINALGTMLDAALDRDGTGTVSLKRELEYVEAYLHIIRKRLGDRFIYDCDIGPGLAECRVPKLVLQPIVENAVEHDITPRKGGRLHLTARREEDSLLLEVAHDGDMTAEDQANISRFLSDGENDADAVGKHRHVGLRNVAMRLKLLYGESSTITITQDGPGVICARIRLPI